MKKAIMCFVALLTIAAAATGPARAQSTYTVSHWGFDGSSYNWSYTNQSLPYELIYLSPEDVIGQECQSFTNVYVSSGGDGNVSVNYEEQSMSISVTGAFEGTATIHCEGSNGDGGVSRDVYVVCTVPQMYTSEVSITSLVVGDTLAEGATITGSNDDGVSIDFGRTKENGVVPSFWTNLHEPPTVIGTNGTISGTYTPVDGNGQDGNAWVVTNVNHGEYGGTDVSLAGIRIPGPPHNIRLAEGTEDAAHWSLASGDAQVPGTQVLENVMSGSELTATYNGTQKVKSVKAVKYVPPAATVTTAPTATTGDIVAGSETALVNAGAANGGTMMYAVTTTNTKPTSTDGFSASIPTAEGRTAGTYYVWYYAKADAEHSDSEIAGPVNVTLAVMYTVTWNSTNVFNSAHEDDEVSKFYTNPLTYEGVTISFSGTSVSSFYAYDDQYQTGGLRCYGNNGDSFTFTAPQGKKFCKIEIINNSSVAFTNYGDWTKDVINHKIVWSGTAANAVTLGGTALSAALNLNSIVFKLIDD